VAPQDSEAVEVGHGYGHGHVWGAALEPGGSEEAGET
jgi:hypothetical protein